MSLDVLVTITVDARGDNKLNSIESRAAVEEGNYSDIRKLANEAVARAEAAVGVDRPIPASNEV